MKKKHMNSLPPNKTVLTFMRSTGFTLIELLLVIAILGILTSLSISQYQKNVFNEKNNKTATQMQQTMEAALNYYLDENSQWPDTSLDGIDPSNNQLFTNHYIPNGITIENPNNAKQKIATTAFGTYLAWNGRNKDSSDNPPKEPAKFTLYTEIPGPSHYAKQVASKLPNAIAIETAPSLTNPTPNLCANNDSNCWVEAQIPRPSLTANNPTSSGFCETGKIIEGPGWSCKDDPAYTYKGTSFILTLDNDINCSDTRTPQVFTKINQFSWEKLTNKSNLSNLTGIDIQAKKQISAINTKKIITYKITITPHTDINIIHDVANGKNTIELQKNAIDINPCSKGNTCHFTISFNYLCTKIQSI